MTNAWTHTLSTAELDAGYALTAKLDARFAASDRAFWESRTVAQLHGLKTAAWNCNDGDGFQKAATYLALKGAGQ